jgi:hypothetical protein
MLARRTDTSGDDGVDVGQEVRDEVDIGERVRAFGQLEEPLDDRLEANSRRSTAPSTG